MRIAMDEILRVLTEEDPPAVPAADDEAFDGASSLYPTPPTLNSTSIPPSPSNLTLTLISFTSTFNRLNNPSTSPANNVLAPS